MSKLYGINNDSNYGINICKGFKIIVCFGLCPFDLGAKLKQMIIFVHTHSLKNLKLSIDFVILKIQFSRNNIF